MDCVKTAQDIIQLVGGVENVQKVFHCMTRLRFHLHNYHKIERNRIESLPGVMGTNRSGEEFQVIIGMDVSNVYNTILSILPNKAAL
jgi:beta-glucoside PTS system EIICBA component